MARRKDPSKGSPRTGDGYKAKGKKPTETGIMQMRTVYDRDGAADSQGLRRVQPRGWGIARVVDIFTGRERKR